MRALLFAVSLIIFASASAWAQGPNGSFYGPGPTPCFGNGGSCGNLPVVALQTASNEVIGTDGTITAGTNAFCSPSTTFTLGDVGKAIILDGSGTALADQIGTITGYTSQHCVTTSFNAVQTTPWAGLLAVQPGGTSQAGAGSYAPGATLTVVGGTNVTTAAVLTIQTTKLVSASINATGSGGTNGTCTLTGTTGTPATSYPRFSISATVSGGSITALGTISVSGDYTTNPTSLTAEPVTSSCGGLTGATLTLNMGALNTLVTTQGQYGAFPANPVSTTTSGSGTGATLNLWTSNFGGIFRYGTDDTTAVNNAIASSMVSGGAVLVLPAGHTLMLGAMVLPNSGATNTTQNPIRITGAGDAQTGYEQQGACRAVGCPSALSGAGSYLDMAYSGSGSQIAKIDTRGAGTLELDHFTIEDEGTDNFPFSMTTNTTLKIHDMTFSGNPTCYQTTCQQNAIQLGPISTVGTFYTNQSNAPFQGYGTNIERNFFDRVSIAVAWGASANVTHLEANRVGWTSGSSNSRSAPYVFYGVGLQVDYNTILGGYVEMGGYNYAINTIASSGTSVSFNSFIAVTQQDEVMGAPTLGFAYFDTNAISNSIIANTDPPLGSVILNGPGTFNGVLSLTGNGATYLPNAVTVNGLMLTKSPVGADTCGSTPAHQFQVGCGSGQVFGSIAGGATNAGDGAGLYISLNGSQQGYFGNVSAYNGSAFTYQMLVAGFAGLQFQTQNIERWLLSSTGEFQDYTVAAPVVPTTGQTVTLATGVQRTIIAPAGSLAALTVTLPACNTANNGEVKIWGLTQAVAALTVNASSGSVSGAPAAGAVGALGFVCYGAGTTWYPSL